MAAAPARERSASAELAIMRQAPEPTRRTDVLGLAVVSQRAEGLMRGGGAEARSSAIGTAR